MSDLINRQDIRYDSMLRPLGNGNYEECEVAYRDEIEAMPSAERKGKWIRHYDDVKNIYCGICIECSECGEMYVVEYVEDMKFCRNCGARMVRGEEDERTD